ncbi:uncharacterized protein [Primulina huaijiensis]|uniref:uncharacterized protein isoform X1 n=1 Tax=Primulina huaijiensis TaxID=1492673 RepID=UPI003CC70658
MSTSSAAGFTLEGIQDVQDHPWENEEEFSSMSSERYRSFYHLMQMGNKAFRDNRLDQAIDFYTRANNIKPSDSVVLSNRCITYLLMSQFLKHRPSSASEYRPLSGLDPITHAGLALKDAEKLLSLQSNSVSSYILNANALILLEKYELACDVILEGLQIDPLSNSLLKLQKSIPDTCMRRSNIKPQRTDDYDCTLCLKLLYEPVTTPCGHSFCRSCLFQTTDRGNRCPLCRTVLLISPVTCAISVTLKNIIERNFPEEYGERKLEHESLTKLAVDLLPLFVMDVILPCQKFQLNIFEPRYRLMVRRIMEGNRRMGMVINESIPGSIADHACEMEITDCEPLPDGRFFLEVESRRRCRIIRHWDQDGYRIAEVEWLQDICPHEGTKEKEDLLEMTNKAALYARQWLKETREESQEDRTRSAELLKIEASMPSTKDPECFSFWLVQLTDRRTSERLDLLRIRDAKERIRRGLLYMKIEEQRRRVQ